MSETNENKFGTSGVIIIILVLALGWVVWSNYGAKDAVPAGTTGPTVSVDGQVANVGALSGQTSLVGDEARSAAEEAEAKAAAEAERVEIAALVAQFGKLIILPTGEEPRLATVLEAEALAKDNAFFAGSQDGDKVLIYVQAGKAYLLSPKRNLIVNVGPIVNEEEKAS